jgi:hypothetical protein
MRQRAGGCDDGCVYIVTTPHMRSVVKVGFWRGTLPRLRSRYVTSYGKEVELTVFRTRAPVQVEALFKRAFEGACTECELYDRSHVAAYEAWLAKAVDLVDTQGIAHTAAMDVG